MTETIPTLTEDGGHLLITESQDLEDIWYNELTEVERGLSNKLIDKGIIVSFGYGESPVGADDSYKVAQELDYPVNGDSQICPNGSGEYNFTLFYTGYSPDSHHQGFNIEGTYSSVKIARIAKHFLISERVPVHWEGRPTSVLRW